MIVKVEMPCCGADTEVEVEWEGGDLVPYGSTTARTPAGWVPAETIFDCPFCGRELTTTEIDEIDQAAVDAADRSAPDEPSFPDRWEEL